MTDDTKAPGVEAQETFRQSRATGADGPEAALPSPPESVDAELARTSKETDDSISYWIAGLEADFRIIREERDELREVAESWRQVAKRAETERDAVLEERNEARAGQTVAESQLADEVQRAVRAEAERDRLREALKRSSRPGELCWCPLGWSPELYADTYPDTEGHHDHCAANRRLLSGEPSDG